MRAAPTVFVTKYQNFDRHALLLPLLAHSVPFYVRLPTKDSMALRGKGHSGTHRMAGDAHLGIRQSARAEWSFPADFATFGKQAVLGVAECVEQRVGDILDSGCQYPGFYG